MFGIFKRKKNDPKRDKKPELVDLDQQPLVVGDKVESLRYDLGISVLIEEDGGLHYQSQATGTKVHWTKMIDASTEFQKVRKVSP